ncbi:MAG TPA: TIM barrel protein [Puia sp.]|nr:TIM barrel protein [Puia sp.]
MKKISRRNFIGKSSMGMGAALVMSRLPFSAFAEFVPAWKDQPIGFQTYPIREMIVKDFPGTLKTMSGQGYQLVEMCSPQGYVSSGFGPLVNMKPADMRKVIEDAGLHCPSCHFTFPELTDNLDERIEFAKQLGLTQMICSTFWLPKTATLNDYLESADKLNKSAEKIKNAGMQAGFHNHEFEFAKLDNQLIYDALMARFDPNLVKMQFQTEVINLGYKASTYFNKYPGRFISAHLSDWTADKKEVPIGQGIIDWKEFFASAKTGGVQNFFVEMKFDTFKDSATYIHQL